MSVAEIFVLFLRGVQLVLRSRFLTVLDLNEVNVMLEFAEIFGSVLSGDVDLLKAGGAAIMLHVSLSCLLPLRIIHPLSLFCCLPIWTEVEHQDSIWTARDKSISIRKLGLGRPILVHFLLQLLHRWHKENINYRSVKPVSKSCVSRTLLCHKYLCSLLLQPDLRGVPWIILGSVCWSTGPS